MSDSVDLGAQAEEARHQLDLARQERDTLQRRLQQARRSLTGIASCSTCEVCRGVALIALRLTEDGDT